MKKRAQLKAFLEGLAELSKKTGVTVQTDGGLAFTETKDIANVLYTGDESKGDLFCFVAENEDISQEKQTSFSIKELLQNNDHKEAGVMTLRRVLKTQKPAKRSVPKSKYNLTELESRVVKAFLLKLVGEGIETHHDLLMEATKRGCDVKALAETSCAFNIQNLNLIPYVVDIDETLVNTLVFGLVAKGVLYVRGDYISLTLETLKRIPVFSTDPETIKEAL